MTIAQRLADIRAALGLSQVKMGEITGIGRDSWRRYENGDLPTGEPLEKLAKLGFSIDWIFTGLGAMRVGGMAEEGVPYNPYPIDGELMGRVTDAIVKLYNDENVRLPPVDQGRLAALFYCEVELVPDADARVGALQYLVESKRRELRQAPNSADSSKRQV